MKLQATWSILALFAGLASPLQAADREYAHEIGVREISVQSEARGRDLSVFVWYPLSAGTDRDAGAGQPVSVGEDRIFKGTPALMDAEPADGRFPLIVLSHGSGASVQKMGWLAADLASRGFVVAGPNHPGTTSGDSTPEDTPKLWERTDDLSLVMSTLLRDPDWAGHVDPDRIGVLGFSLGGAAAMTFAGAKVNLEAYARYCETYPDMADCRWFAGGQGYRNRKAVSVPPFDLRSMDRGRFESSMQDPRVAAAVLVDPSMARAVDAESLAAINIPMHFINLGNREDVPVSVEAQGLAALVPNGSHAFVDGSAHFSFLPQCQDGAVAFMEAIGEKDALCTDAGTRSRADIHLELGDIVEAAFLENL